MGNAGRAPELALAVVYGGFVLAIIAWNLRRILRRPRRPGRHRIRPATPQLAAPAAVKHPPPLVADGVDRPVPPAVADRLVDEVETFLRRQARP